MIQLLMLVLQLINNLNWKGEIKHVKHDKVSSKDLRLDLNRCSKLCSCFDENGVRGLPNQLNVDLSWI